MRRAPGALLAVLLALTPSVPATAALDRWSGGGPPAGALSVLAVDPRDPATLFGASGTYVYSSSDAGSSWARAGRPSASPGWVTALAVDPGTGALYVVSGGMLFRSSDAGATWRELDLPNVTALALLPGSPAILLAAGESGVHRSTDGGFTWSWASEGLGESASGVYQLRAAPSAPGTGYAVSGDYLFRTADGGRTWAAAALPPDTGYVSALAVDPAAADRLYLAGATGVLRSPDAGETWLLAGTGLPSPPTDYVSVLAAAGTRTQTTLYAATYSALYRSLDQGTTWARIGDGLAPGGGIYSLALDPSDALTLYCLTDAGVLASADGGETWRPASAGLPGRATQAVAAGPGGSVYAGLTYGGVARSTDRGDTWQLGAGGGVEYESVLALATASGSPATVYAGSYAGRVYRSRDGGATWVQANRGLPHAVVWDLEPDLACGECLLAATELGVYRTADAAASWARSSHGLPNTGVRAIAVAPDRPQLAYAGLERGGVWRSADGGESWRPTGLGRYTVLSLAVSPGRPETVLAATLRGGIWRTGNAGRTWRRVVAKTGLTGSVVFDPKQAGRMLVASGRRVLLSTDGGLTFAPFEEGLPQLGGSPYDPEADRPRVVVQLAATPGGAYAATWSGAFAVTFAADGEEG